MAGPLKVLHLIEGLGSGGAERLLYTNLKHLDPAVVESKVATVFAHDVYWKQPIEDLGFKVHELGVSGYRNMLSGVSRLRNYLRSNRPDVIHTHLFAANIVGRLAGRLTGIPVISSIHSPEYEPEAVAATPGAKRKIAAARILDGWSARVGCTHMIAVSDFVRQSVSTNLRYPIDKISVLHNPVDLEVIRPESGSEEEFSGRAESGDPLRYLVSVGRLSPEKAFLSAVEALPAIVEAVPNVRLVSVGSLGYPDYKRDVLERVAQLGLENSVWLLGERSDIGRILAACDVFVFPSVFEGLGIALAEAMAAGCACVATNIRPFGEFVESGVNGVLVPPDDPAALARSIIDLLTDEPKRKAMGDAARDTAIRMFSPEPAARKLVETYAAVARVDQRTESSSMASRQI